MSSEAKEIFDTYYQEVQALLLNSEEDPLLVAAATLAALDDALGAELLLSLEDEISDVRYEVCKAAGVGNV